MFDLAAFVPFGLTVLGGELPPLDAFALLDILALSLLIYVVLIWLRRMASRSVALGLGALAGLYLVARVLGLEVTGGLIESSLIFVVFAALIAFQDEIRRLFRLGSWRGSSGVDPTTRAMLVEALARLADESTGALVVCPGAESLEGLLTGGTDLGGEPSVPLLLSLFNPATPGHDGAVVFDGDRLGRFGVHLPLSRHAPGHHGTRHAAALGLSEQSDALVLVVSEERGTISMARRGELRGPLSVTELSEALEAFWGAEEAGTHRLRRAMLPALAALVLAGGTWLIMTPSEIAVQRELVLPVEIRGLAPEMRVGALEPGEIAVTVSGTASSFERLDASALAVTVSAAERPAGEHEIALQREHLALPRGLSVQAMDPAVVRLDVVQLVDIPLPVEVRVTGELPAGWEVVELVPDPAEVQVRMAPGRQSSIERVSTEPVDLAAAADGQQLRVPLEVPPDMQVVGEGDVQVEVRLRPSVGEDGDEGSSEEAASDR